MFAVASLSGHYVMARLYRPLVLSNSRHAILLRVWIVLCTFVGIQLAWQTHYWLRKRGRQWKITGFLGYLPYDGR
jgi:hypothetical protein